VPFQGIYNLDDPREKANCLSAIRNERGEKTVIVRDPVRSDAQNRFYWGQVVEPLSEWLTASEGQVWTRDDTHEYLKRSFLPLREYPDPVTGELVMLPMSTTKLTKPDFTVLCEKGLALLDWLRNNKEESDERESGQSRRQPNPRPRVEVPAERDGGVRVRPGRQPEVSHRRR
jgi:hypothetical protein